MAAATDPAISEKLELDRRSNVLLFGTEGPTDPDLYTKLLNWDGPLPSVSHGAS
jgi:diaminopropionate ammonia-lyase